MVPSVPRRYLDDHLPQLQTAFGIVQITSLAFRQVQEHIHTYSSHRDIGTPLLSLGLYILWTIFGYRVCQRPSFDQTTQHSIVPLSITPKQQQITSTQPQSLQFYTNQYQCVYSCPLQYTVTVHCSQLLKVYQPQWDVSIDQFRMVWKLVSAVVAVVNMRLAVHTHLMTSYNPS